METPIPPIAESPAPHSKIGLIIGIVVAILLLAGAALYLSGFAVRQETAVSISPIPDRQTYRNDEYGFEFQYPASLHFEGPPSDEHTVPNFTNIAYLSTGKKDLSGISIYLANENYYPPGCNDYNLPTFPLSGWWKSCSYYENGEQNIRTVFKMLRSRNQYLVISTEANNENIATQEMILSTMRLDPKQAELVSVSLLDAGIWLSYPNIWYSEKHEGGITIKDSKLGSELFNVSLITKTAEEQINQVKQQVKSIAGARIISEKSVAVDVVSGTELRVYFPEGGVDQLVYIYLPYRNKTIVITYGSFFPEIEDIVSTIKFRHTHFANWETYARETHGFEIQIPSDWVVHKYGAGESGLVFLSSEMDVQAEKNEIDCEKELPSCLSHGPIGGDNFSFHSKFEDPDTDLVGKNEKIINGIKFTIYKINGLFEFYHYVTYRNGKTYDFSTTEPKLLERILSTFRFTK